MPSYVVTGASRGIGYEFLRQLSSDPSVTVIGLVRDKESTEKKVAADFNRPNVHIVQGDLESLESIKRAATETAQITGGSVDYLIANAAFASNEGHFESISELAEKPEGLEKDLIANFKVNVVGNTHLFNAYVPLMLNGQAKKVVSISTGMADNDFVNKFEIDSTFAYAVSKAALNMVVSKFNARYQREGVLFMSISPGLVDTHDMSQAPPSVLEGIQTMMRKFSAYAPDFKGPISPKESVQKVLSVIEKASLENGSGGSFVSHLGNQQWL